MGIVKNCHAAKKCTGAPHRGAAHRPSSRARNRHKTKNKQTPYDSANRSAAITQRPIGSYFQLTQISPRPDAVRVDGIRYARRIRATTATRASSRARAPAGVRTGERQRR